MILHGAGASSTFGTPCGRQLASGSSFQCTPAARSSYTAFAQGWKGTSSFRSFARFRRYPVGGLQMPERSGLPSGSRGAGAERFGLPSAVRGTDEAGTFVHCANAVAVESARITNVDKVFTSASLENRCAKYKVVFSLME